MSDGIESEDEEDEYDEEEENKENENDDEEKANQTSSETNSPQRKRAKRYSLPIEYTNLAATTYLTFEQFDELPICTWSKSIWNKLLLANYNFWRSKCQIWCRQLHEAFEARDDVFVFLVSPLKSHTKFLDQCRSWSSQASG